jgi:hypothetical protein
METSTCVASPSPRAVGGFRKSVDETDEAERRVWLVEQRHRDSTLRMGAIGGVG